MTTRNTSKAYCIGGVLLFEGKECSVRRDQDKTRNGRLFSEGYEYDECQGQLFRGQRHSGPAWMCGCHVQRWRAFRNGSEGAGGGPPAAGPLVGPQPLPLGVRNTVAIGQSFSAGIEPGAKRARTGGAPPNTSATGVLCAGGEGL